MNDVFTEKITLNSKYRRNKSYRNKRSFMSNKRKNENRTHEKQPLMSKDPNSSDEEIVLHDIRHFNKSNQEAIGNSSLRKVKKSDYATNNGVIVESTNSDDPFLHCDFLDLKIEEGDTLQSISVKYQCAISDIKRANNLISNQDFFARTHLKIPVKKHSLLTEILPPSLDPKMKSTYFDEYDSDIRTINIGIGSSGRSPSPQEAAAFFKRMDEDLVKIMLSTNSQKDSLEAAAVVLTAPQIQPLVKDPYNTVDCGIQWNYLIMFIIIIAVVIPGIIALYMYMRPSHETHDSVYSSSSSSENYNSVPELTNIKAES